MAFAVEIFGPPLRGCAWAGPEPPSRWASWTRERRTTINLKECIRAAAERVVFINTGLPRPHRRRDPHFDGGRPHDPQGDMKSAAWISAYENWNVDIGLECGPAGPRPRSAKGMWAMPDLMAAMLEQKVGHPKAGANTAWVPSPTAATLHRHATTTRSMFMPSRRELEAAVRVPKLFDILSVAGRHAPNWSEEDIQKELDNNAQHSRLCRALDRPGAWAVRRCPTSTMSA